MKKLKNDFPIFQNIKDLVYLDSAATSQKPRVVLSAIQNYYQFYNANVRRGLYPIAEQATEKVEEVRKKVARFINAKSSDEIIFVRNATEAINLVAYTLRGEIHENDIVSATIMEHHSNFVPWQVLAKRQGSIFGVIDIDSNGELQWENGIRQLAGENGKLFAITHVSNVLGTINPINQIIREVKKENKNIKILVDGAQAVPHMKVDVQDLDCDFYAFSGHKMMAGTGIGVLYGKKNLLEKIEPFLFGGDMIDKVYIEETTFADLPFRFEAGTPDIAGIVSLGAAIEYLNSAGINNVQKHEEELVSYCLSEMAKIPQVRVYGPDSLIKRGGLISFVIEGIHSHDIAQVLGDMNICIRSGHHCAMPLHKKLGVTATARVSFYLYNDIPDVDKFIHGVKKTIKIFKK